MLCCVVLCCVVLCCADINSPGALGALQRALQAATLTGSDRDQAAAGSGLRPSGDAWSRLPYPLMSGFSGVVALRGKAAFTCTQVQTGRRVFIKFTQRAYPVEVSCLTGLRPLYLLAAALTVHACPRLCFGPRLCFVARCAWPSNEEQLPSDTCHGMYTPPRRLMYQTVDFTSNVGG